MKRIFCDRCKDEIRGNPIKAIFESVDKENADLVGDQIEIAPDLSRIDLCRECAEHFAGVIARGCKLGAPAKENPCFKAAVEDMIATAQADTSKKKTGQKTTKVALDVGKVFALRNAGWPVKKIAEEMNCSDATIYNALKVKEKSPEPEQQAETN